MKNEEKVKHSGRRPEILWDSAEMTTIHGTVIGIEATRGEIQLLFGSRTVQTGRRETTVMVSDRVILNPFAAKRLLVLMRKIMARHQLPFGMGSSDLRTYRDTTN